jgi:hypothetical protein
MSVSTRRKRSIDLAACIYGTLLIAYPSTFRREFGAQMVQVFRTACRNSLQAGSWGLVRFWIHALVDLGASASAEQLAAAD